MKLVKFDTPTACCARRRHGPARPVAGSFLNHGGVHPTVHDARGLMLGGTQVDPPADPVGPDLAEVQARGQHERSRIAEPGLSGAVRREVVRHQPCTDHGPQTPHRGPTR